MGPPSELADGLEPHDHVLLRRLVDRGLWEVMGGGGGVPGVVGMGGYLEGGIPGTQPGPSRGQIEAYLYIY